MRKEIDYKVINGKLLRLDVEVIEKKIVFFKLFGDFFVYPETAISLLENCVLGDINGVKERLDKTILENKIKIIGFGSEDIEKCLFNN